MAATRGGQRPEALEQSMHKDADEEAASAPRRRFSAEAEQGAWWNITGHNADTDNVDADMDASPLSEEGSPTGEGSQSPGKEHFHSVYREKVEALKVKAGDKHHFPISGNLYMFRYLCPFGEDSGLIQKKSTLFVTMGLNLIMLVQICGPPIVLLSAFYDIKFGKWGLGNWEYKMGSDEKGISYIGQRVLGVFFLVLFIMNGTYVVGNDRRETRKLLELNELFTAEAEERTTEEGIPYRKPQKCWLWVGAFVNCWCLVTSCVAMMLLFVCGEGPKDVLFDAFGLTFLYNLDDIGGDLAFLDEKWDEDLMGDMYGVMRDIPHALEDIKAKRKKSFTPDNIYKCLEGVMYIGIVLLPITFIFLDMQVKAEGGAPAASAPVVVAPRLLMDALSAPEQVKLADVSMGELMNYVRSMKAP